MYCHLGGVKNFGKAFFNSRSMYLGSRTCLPHSPVELSEPIDNLGMTLPGGLMEYVLVESLC